MGTQGARLQDISAGPGGGQPAFGLGDLFQNKLFLQMLAGAGQSIGAGQGPAAGLSPVIQQNISSQNYMKLLAKMLAGEIPEGGKITHTDTGTNISMPRESLAPSKPSISESPGSDESLQQSRDFFRGGQYSPEQIGGANPFVDSQPHTSAMDSSPSDLAGLTPEMISNALQFKFAKEEMGQKRFSDIMDAMYKGGMLGVAERGAAVGERGVAVDEAGIPISASKAETDRIDAYREWYEALSKDERTELQKNFEYAVAEGYTKDIIDFKNAGGTPSSYDEYQLAKEEGYKGKYVDFIRMKGESGSTRISIGEKVAEKIALANLAGQLYFKDPGWIDDVNSYLLRNVESNIWATPPEQRSLVRVQAATDYIEQKIVAGGGTVEGYTRVGNSIVFNIIWGDGTTSKVPYALK